MSQSPGIASSGNPGNDTNHDSLGLSQEMTITVYQLGGSLLSLPGLAFRVRELLAQHSLAQHSDRRPLLLVGGGPTTDIVRGWDRLHRLGEERSHWLALRSLMLNEALLLELMPETRLITSRNEAKDAWSSAQLPLVCAHGFLRAEEARTNSPLPHTWDVTSDSIAAWITLHWPADQLILLKSVSQPVDDDPQGTGIASPVDPYFQQLVPQLPNIGWVNIRNSGLRVEAFQDRAAR